MFYPNHNDRKYMSVSFEKVESVDHQDNYGRTAISWPTDDLKNVEKSIVENGGKVLTPYLRLVRMEINLIY